jgi:hypothetical protein
MEKEMIIQMIRERYSDEDYYKQVMGELKLEFDMFYSNIDVFNIRYLIDHCKLDQKITAYIIEAELDDLDYIITKQQLEDNLIDKILTPKNPLHNEDRLYHVQECQRISCKLIQKHKDHLDMRAISMNQYLDCRFLIDNREQLFWSDIIMNTRMAPVINEGFITLFAETGLWDNIAYCDIPLSSLLKFGKYFTDLSFQGFTETLDLSREEVEKQIHDFDEIVKQNINEKLKT